MTKATVAEKHKSVDDQTDEQFHTISLITGLKTVSRADILY